MGRMRFGSALALSALLVLVTSALAHAKGASSPPPGNSAVSQYLEQVPGVTGGKPANRVPSQGAGSTHGNSAIPPSTRRALASQGATGAADASLAQATAPSSAGSGKSTPAGHASRARRAQSGGASSAATGASSSLAFKSASSPTSSVIKALGGSSSGGLGWLLPAILIASVVAAGVLALLRRRRAA